MLSPVSGPVTRIVADVGTPVSKGSVLATVSSPDFATAIATYSKAVATAANLQRIADQDVQLFKVDAIARRDLDQAQTDASTAIADREAALQALSSLGIDAATIEQIRSHPTTTTVPAAIRSPIAGTVVERLITPGELLSAGTTPAFTVANLSTMWVLANVFGDNLANVARGERATITTDATKTPFSGTVDYIGALVDTATRATSVRIVVPNRGDLLKRDMFVHVSIQSNRQHSGILVPSASILRDDENLPFVFVQAGPTPSSGFARRRVTLGAQVGDSYEIPTGLTAGDKVVAEGALFLQFAESQ